MSLFACFCKIEFHFWVFKWWQGVLKLADLKLLHAYFHPIYTNVIKWTNSLLFWLFATIMSRQWAYKPYACLNSCLQESMFSKPVSLTESGDCCNLHTTNAVFYWQSLYLMTPLVTPPFSNCRKNWMMSRWHLKIQHLMGLFLKSVLRHCMMSARNLRIGHCLVCNWFLKSWPSCLVTDSCSWQKVLQSIKDNIYLY